MKARIKTTRILFNRLHTFEIFAVTNLDICRAGSLWMEAWASDEDIETFKRNEWWFEILK